MRLQHGLLFFWLAATAGCAVLAGPPPAPPIAVPMAGGPKELRWSPFKWKPGSVLTYNVQSFVEVKVGERTDVDQVRHILQLRGMERTAKGGVRVQVLVDTTEHGLFIVDEAGDIQDAASTKPESAEEFKAMVQLAQHPLAKELASKVWTVGQSHAFELPTTSVREMIPSGWASSLHPTITINCEFIGYAWLGEMLVVGLQTTIPNMLRESVHRRWHNSNERSRFDTLTVNEVEYRDPARGFVVSKYGVSTMFGEVGGKPLILRSIQSTTLDREKSRELQ